VIRSWRRPPGPPSALPVRSATASRTGTRRENQDAVGEAAVGELSLHVLADGLGGHARGDEAARLAVQRCVSGFRARPGLDEATLEELMQDAHRALAQASGAPGRTASGREGLRSTLVLLAMDGVRARWGHVGDSRLYHFRASRIVDHTRDHSVPEMLLRAGEIREEEIRGHPDRNRLLRALGQESPLQVSVAPEIPVEEKDAFLLCSDGWWENIREDEMERTLAEAGDPAGWLAAMAARIQAAPGSSRDNYTAIGVLIGAVP
jgi:PPM family protein phosphatase